MELREWILAYGFSSDGKRFNGNLERRVDAPLFIQQLHNYTSYIHSCKIALRLRLFLSGWATPPCCPYCESELTPNVRSELPTFCNAKCANKFEPTRRRIEETNRGRYGGDTPAQSATVRRKMERTCLSRYGSEYFWSTPGAQEKRIKTSNLKYGCDHPAQSSAIKQKIRKTNMSRYGCENTFQVDAFKMKSRSTCRARYGKDYAMQDKTIFDKARDTCRARYGRDYSQQAGLPAELYDSDSILHGLEMYGPIGLADKWAISLSTLYRYAKLAGLSFDTSMEESHIVDYLRELDVENIVTSSRSIIKPLELDIYLPDYNLAIEYDGVYWHTENQGKNRSYHLSKTELCEAQGIQLLHIFSTDQLEIWKSLLSYKLGKTQNKIGGRQTTIKNISRQEEITFLTENHLQGYVPSREAWGLFYHDSLVCCMTFSHSRFSSAEWELLRFCTRRDWRVIGGASKLLKHFRKKENGSIISYANRRWSDGQLYKSLGMVHSHTSPPNFFYTKDHRVLYSRNQFQKHKLERRLENFDPELTADENMKLHGYDRIWDCGNHVFMS